MGTGGGRPDHRAPGSEADGVRPADIAVIVTAYGRRQFLGEALESLRNQTLPRQRIELCIVTDFPNEPDGSTEGYRRVTRLRPSETSEGVWIARALEATRAPVLAFLDDDDRFVPRKLATVVDRFGREPALGYLRNGLTFFGPGSTGVSLAESRFAGGRAEWVSGSQKTDAAVARLWQEGAAFNASSVSIRREALDRATAHLARIRSGYGAFVFFAALASPYGLRVDPEALTEYRCHAGNESPSLATSRAAWWHRSLRLASAREHDVDEILRFLEERGCRVGGAPLRRARAQNRALMELAALAPRRARTFRALLEFLASERPRDVWSDRGLLGACALAATIAPGTGRRLAGDDRVEGPGAPDRPAD